MMNDKEPQTFKTQREAYWYVQGWRDAQERANKMMNRELAVYAPDLLDHLPSGEEDEQ